MQQQWRDIGFAGSHQESKLWQKFRAINDQVFAKRDQIKSEQHAELEEFAEGFKHNLTNIKAAIENTDKSSSNKILLNNAKDQAGELLSQVLSNKPVLKSVASAIETFIKQTSEQIEKIKSEEESKSWQSLFNLLEKTDICLFSII